MEPVEPALPCQGLNVDPQRGPSAASSARQRPDPRSRLATSRSSTSFSLLSASSLDRVPPRIVCQAWSSALDAHRVICRADINQGLKGLSRGVTALVSSSQTTASNCLGSTASK